MSSSDFWIKERELLDWSVSSGIINDSSARCISFLWSLSKVLGEVELISLHCDILSKVFITIHTSCKLCKSLWLLVEMEFITLHCDVFSKIFISV